MSSAVGVLLFVVVIFVVILFHEAGHFVTAKAFGIKVEEFFVGFGPRLWSFRKGETEYGIKALPFGGYVRIAGMNPFQEPAPEDRPRTFGAKPAWQRAIVLLAGSATHFILALLFLFIFFTLIGIPILRPAVARVERTLDGDPSPAAAAGLRPGDRIVRMDGRRMDNSQEVVDYTRTHVNEEIRVAVLRDGSEVVLNLTPVLSRVQGEEVGRLGIVLSEQVVGRERSNPFGAMADSATATGDMIVRSFQAIGKVFGPEGIARVGRLLFGEEERTRNDPVSVVGAARLAGQATREGFWDALLFLFAGFNVFVGILNLLPLPPLDGGHVAVLAFEKATGRKVDMRRLVPVTALVAGFLILFGLSLTFLDVVRPIPNPFQ